MEIAVEELRREPAFGGAEYKSREHLGQMPPQLPLLYARGKPEKSFLARLEPVRMYNGYLFGDVRASHANDGILRRDAPDDRLQRRTIGEDAPHHMVGRPDGSPVTPRQLPQNVGHLPGRNLLR